jgi:hypothetical protein
MSTFAFEGPLISEFFPPNGGAYQLLNDAAEYQLMKMQEAYASI